MDSVNEKETCSVVATFKDKNGTLVTPSSGIYRIDDVFSGAEIKDDTGFSPGGSTHSIDITSAENAILDGAHKREVRVVTVTATLPSGSVSVEEYRYKVVNFRFKA